jgi:hypothetical protein
MRNTWNFGKPITPSASYDFSLFLYIFFEFFRGGRNFAFPRPDTSVRPSTHPGMSGHQAGTAEHQHECGRACPSTNPGMAGHQPRMSEHQEAYARAPTQSCPGIMQGWPSMPEHPPRYVRASTRVWPSMPEHQPRHGFLGEVHGISENRLHRRVRMIFVYFCTPFSGLFGGVEIPSSRDPTRA